MDRRQKGEKSRDMNEFVPRLNFVFVLFFFSESFSCDKVVLLFSIVKLKEQKRRAWVDLEMSHASFKTN